MALHRVHREIVVHRELTGASWSLVVVYAVDDKCNEIVAETFETYRKHRPPQRVYRKSRGQFRVSPEKAPKAVLRKWLRLTGSKLGRAKRREMGLVAV